MPHSKPQRIALALGSGGARGYAHIGVINELNARGFEIVNIAGTSMGAVVGGAFAAGGLDAYAEWVLGLSQRGVLRQLDPALSTTGLLRAERILTHMSDVVGDRRIEDLPIRFTAVTVDLLTGREVWLDQGPLGQAIRASIGIPGIITPATVNGRILVDGGLLDPVPVAAVAAADADIVVAVSLQGRRSHADSVSPAYESADRRPIGEWWERFRSNATGLIGADTLSSVTQRWMSLRSGSAPDPDEDLSVDLEQLPSLGLLDILTLSLEASQGALALHSLAANPPDILITVPKDACRTLDFHKAGPLIELGRKLASEALDRAGLRTGDPVHHE